MLMKSHIHVGLLVIKLFLKFELYCFAVFIVTNNEQLNDKKIIKKYLPESCCIL